MRPKRSLGLGLALALMSSVVVLGAPTAEAAGGITCKTLTGKMTLNPPLPATTAPPLAGVTFSIKNAKLGGCTGPGGTSGLLSFKVKFKTAERCGSIHANHKAVGTETIIWANKTKSSSSAITFTVLAPGPTNPKVNRSTLNGKIQSGLLAGKKQTGSVVDVFPKAGAPTGDCLHTALKSVALKTTVGALTIK
jgi:hypothetical protein